MFGKRTPEQREKLTKQFEALMRTSAAAQDPTKTESASDHDSVEGEKPPTESGLNTYNRLANETVRGNTSEPIVEINNFRLFTIADLDLHLLESCISLSLRKNLIHELTPIPEDLAARLEELDLFDNKLKGVGNFFEASAAPRLQGAETPIPSPNTHIFCSLRKLDLSYNQMKKISGLESLSSTLTELYLVENKIKDITGLETLVNLELLELGGNRIREIGSGLATLTKLKQLWLGKNKIVTIGDSLRNLVYLELLSLQANRILAVEPNDFAEGSNPNLQELYLSENGISEISNLNLHNLRILDFSFNPISVINESVISVQNMPHLTEFWLTDAKLERWEEVGKLSSFQATLRTVYLERNPIEQDKRYRDKVYMYLPFVNQIDSWPVVNKGNLESDRTIERRPNGGSS